MSVLYTYSNKTKKLIPISLDALDYNIDFLNFSLTGYEYDVEYNNEIYHISTIDDIITIDGTDYCRVLCVRTSITRSILALYNVDEKLLLLSLDNEIVGRGVKQIYDHSYCLIYDKINNGFVDHESGVCSDARYAKWFFNTKDGNDFIIKELERLPVITLEPVVELLTRYQLVTCITQSEVEIKANHTLKHTLYRLLWSKGYTCVTNSVPLVLDGTDWLLAKGDVPSSIILDGHYIPANSEYDITIDKEVLRYVCQKDSILVKNTVHNMNILSIYGNSTMVEIDLILYLHSIL